MTTYFYPSKNIDTAAAQWSWIKLCYAKPRGTTQGLCRDWVSEVIWLFTHTDCYKRWSCSAMTNKTTVTCNPNYSFCEYILGSHAKIVMQNCIHILFLAIHVKPAQPGKGLVVWVCYVPSEQLELERKGTIMEHWPSSCHASLLKTLRNALSIDNCSFCRQSPG